MNSKKSLFTANRCLLAILCGLGIWACAPVTEDSADEQSALGASPKFLDADEAIPGEYIVVLASHVESKKQTASLAATYRASVFHTYENVLSGFAAKMTEADAIQLSKDPAVAFVEKNGMMHTSEVQTGATWGIDRTDQVSLPLDTNYNYTLTGEGVNAVVVDTGVDARHPDFEGRVGPGFNAGTVGAPDDASDVQGHGTHVAGTMASKTWGIAKKAKIIPVRVCNAQGQCPNADILRGIDWVTANVAKPAVVNMSLGGSASGGPTATELAIKNSIAAGITYVVAAGNSNRDACTFSPARLPEVITIGASDSADRRSSFSNWGTCLDVFAPGSRIVSARRNSTTSTTMDGTSMASPHAAGVAALILQAHPNATPAEMEAIVRLNATPDKVTNPGTGSPNRLLHLGAEIVTPPPPPPPPPPPSEDAGAPGEDASR